MIAKSRQIGMLQSVKCYSTPELGYYVLSQPIGHHNPAHSINQSCYYVISTCIKDETSCNLALIPAETVLKKILISQPRPLATFDPPIRILSLRQAHPHKDSATISIWDGGTLRVPFPSDIQRHQSRSLPSCRHHVKLYT
ncbi:hypothetical protein TNCV_1920591 [Trichonephila clavipes]|nr:hypothetical protein TNCV_1920591 [Trichonephila clavipes]